MTKKVFGLVNLRSFKVAIALNPNYVTSLEFIDINSIDRNNSLLVYISNNWIDENPNTQRERDLCCVRGIEQIWSQFAPGMTECYIWLDFVGVTPDTPLVFASPTDTPTVIRDFHFVFTPLEGLSNTVDTYTPTGSIFDTQLSAKQKYLPWNGPRGYTQSAWSRVDLLCASLVPVPESVTLANFKGAPAKYLEAGIRPHFTYGSKSRKAAVLAPFPLATLYDEFDPALGELPSDENHDRILFTQVTERIKSFRKYEEGEYSGDIHPLTGKRHTVSTEGTATYPDSSVYKGGWRAGKWHGSGSYRTEGGVTYVGTFANGATYSNGVLLGDNMERIGRWVEGDRGTVSPGRQPGGSISSASSSFGVSAYF